MDDVRRAGVPPAGRLRRTWRALAADVSPLREHPDYRRLWAGATVSLLGSQMTAVAVPIQVFQITHSSLYVGLTGLVILGPLVGFGLVGGAIADAVDRRRLLLVTSTALTVLSAVLALQAAAQLRRLWLLYLVVGVQSAFMAVDSPSRGATIPRLVPSRQLPAANALQQVSMQLTLTGGPLLAGVVIGGFGLQWAYWVDVASFFAALYAVWRLPALRPLGEATRAGVASIAEGLRFLRGRTNLLMTFLVDINAMVFGMPRALFPAIGTGWFHGGPRTVSLLYAATSAGGLLGALFGGWFGRVRRQGLAILVAVAVWGAAVAGFGLSRTLWLAVLLLATAGAADMVSAVYRSTILQVATPDALRGRLQGVFIVVVAGGPRLGDVEAGSVASAFGLTFSVVSGGVICLLGVVALAALFPRFARYDARNPQA